MSPTFEAGGRAQRDYIRLTRAQRRAFDAARRRLVTGLRESPPRFEPALRVKRVQGRPGVWELSWAADGRATFSYGPEVLAGEAHILWRRIGDHSVLVDP